VTGTDDDSSEQVCVSVFIVLQAVLPCILVQLLLYNLPLPNVVHFCSEEGGPLFLQKKKNQNVSRTSNIPDCTAS